MRRRWPDELSPTDHRRLHEQCVLLSRMYREFFPAGETRWPSNCPYDARPGKVHGTAGSPLAGFMHANLRP